MEKEKITQSEITVAINEMNKKLEKKNKEITTLGEKIESINKVMESRVAAKKKCDSKKKQLETENDLLQIKTLRELCNKANIPMQDVFAAAFKVLVEKVSNRADEDVQTAEKSAEDFHEDNPSIETKNFPGHDSKELTLQKDKGKLVNPVEKAKMEQRERLAQKQAAPSPKTQSVQKTSLEERLGLYMGH